MVIGIIVLVGVGIAGVVVGLLSQRRKAAMAKASTVGCADLPLVAGENEPVTLEVVGKAGAGEEPLTAPFSGTPCVWYRTTVTHRYRERRRRENETEWVTKNEKVAEDTSHEPFSVTDVSGSVRVHPQGAKVIGASESIDRFEHGRPGFQGAPASGSLGERALSMLGDVLSRQADNTIGYRYQEWVLRAEGELYVLAGARRDQKGVSWLERPASGPFLISTKSEDQLASRARLGVILGYGIAAAALAGAVALGVTAALS